MLLAAAAALATAAAELPTDAPAETQPHLAITMELPSTADVTSFLANETYLYEWRRVFAAGTADEAAALPFIVVNEIIDAAGAAKGWSDLYNGNAYAPGGGDAARLLRAAAGRTSTSGSGSGRALQAATPSPVTITTFYYYGLDFSLVAGAKDANATGILAALVAHVSSASAWSAFVASPAAVGLNVTAAGTLASAGAAATTAAVTPRPRYQPFGDLTGTTVGSFIGIAVFFITVAFVSIPAAQEAVAKRWRAGRKPTAAAAAAGAHRSA